MPGFLPVGGIVRGIFLAWGMGKFYKGQPAAIACLGGEHETDFFRCLFWCKVDNPLDVLYRVPVAVAVAQPAVNKGGRPGPEECHKAVVGIPCIHHGVEFRAWGCYLKPA